MSNELDIEVYLPDPADPESDGLHIHVEATIEHEGENAGLRGYDYAEVYSTKLVADDGSETPFEPTAEQLAAIEEECSEHIS